MSLKGRIGIVVGAFLLAAVVLAGRAFSVQAAPAAPTDIPITQPDGTRITVHAWGDEFMSGLETQDGYTILQDPSSGYWVYAQVGPTGELGAVIKDSEHLPDALHPMDALQLLIVGRDEPAGLAKHARPAAGAGLQSKDPAQMGTGALLQQPNSGDQYVLVLLVEFANTQHTYPDTYFRDMVFGSGGIKSYYSAASYNALNLVPVPETNGAVNDGVVGWIPLSTPHPYASFNDLSGANIDLAPGVVAAALSTVVNDIDFAALDTNDDSYISPNELHILVVTAGYENSYGGNSAPMPKFWAHHDSLKTPLLLDGVYVGDVNHNGGYSLVGEKHGNHAATMGPLTHELGHDLNWPDLYDTSGLTQGVGNWSLMGGGAWNGLAQMGDTPALPDAWLKWYQGWITPTPAVDGQSYSLTAAATIPATGTQALLLMNNPNGVDWEFYVKRGTGEYWLVENRSQTGFDGGLPGCGLLIWHINEMAALDNSANNGPEPLVSLEQADGKNQLMTATYGMNRGDSGDPYPGFTGNVYFNDYSRPNSRYYSNLSSLAQVHVTSTGCAASMALDFSAHSPVLDKTVYLPIIGKTETAVGLVTHQGGPAAGVTIYMGITDNNWSTYSTISTVTDASGRYAFTNTTPQALDANHQYRVYFYNTDREDNGRLLFWNCAPRSGSSGSDTCNMEIADITHKSPSAGASAGLPAAFYWNRRTHTTDSYLLDFYDRVFDGSQYRYNDVCWTNTLGYVDSFLLSGLSPSASLHCSTGTRLYPNSPYYRAMWVYGPNGYGTGRYLWMVNFNAPAALAMMGNDQAVPARQLFSQEDLLKMDWSAR